MYLFFIGMVLLLAGYIVYGRVVEGVIAPDDRETPAVTKFDGIDYVRLPHWKNMLIQLLNIAGVGPVIGVILGVKFGNIVFIIIPIGNIIAGATHDFLVGMMSIRNGGINLPHIIKKYLGEPYYKFFSVFTIFLLLLVVTVFINVPANLIDKSFPNVQIFWWSVGSIFAYYVLATVFPVDKIIGKVYPYFGAMLLFGTFAIFISIIAGLFDNPALLDESASFKSMKWTGDNNHPLFPVLFVTIACGIISGFHGTQSPIVARTIGSERQARSSFYGMMVVEGIIAMVWASAGLAVYNVFPEYFALNPNTVLIRITEYFLGNWMGVVTVMAVTILAVTSGDTSMRSVRLSLAEIFSIDQKPLVNRVLTTLPSIAAVSLLLLWAQSGAESFNKLWNYFAWGNQVLAASTLSAAAVWLFKDGKNGFIALVPGIFMSMVVLSFILWVSPGKHGPVGFGLELNASLAISAAAAAALAWWLFRRGKTP